MNRTTRLRLLAGFTLLCVVAAFIVPPFPQPLDYHQFADERAAFGVENFLNVVSNIGFLFAGIAGLAVVLSGRARFEFASERWPYAVFFFGLLLTAFGSSYYHLAPDNERLFWDRLPMTIAFAGLISGQFVDRLSVRGGLAILVPMLVIGAASVIYWRITERAGVGNVVPYAVLQGYAMVVLLLLAILEPSRYSRGSDLYWVFAWYALSKVLETFDEEVMRVGGVVSGHTLKHVAASVSGFVVCYMLMHRTLHKSEAPAAGKREAATASPR